jgi:hypothetical protein
MASQAVSDCDSQMVEVSGRDTLRHSGIVQNIMMHRAIRAMASQTVSDRDRHQVWAMSG